MRIFTYQKSSILASIQYYQHNHAVVSFFQYAISYVYRVQINEINATFSSKQSKNKLFVPKNKRLISTK